MLTIIGRMPGRNSSGPKSILKPSIDLFAAELLALGAEVRGKDVLPLLSGDLRPEMVEALRRVAAKFKTGCITNNLPANASEARAAGHSTSRR